MNEVLPAALVPYDIDDAPRGVPDIIDVRYDIWTLRVTLDFQDWDGVVYVDFESPRGFRVMDESDSTDMWGDREDADDWLHIVEAGGWIDQESEREGFTGADDDLAEYLIVGANDCVSVMAFDEPRLTVIDGAD